MLLDLDPTTLVDGTTHKMDITPGMKEIDILKQVLNLTNESERR